MKNTDIYKGAMRILSEQIDLDSNEDYQERAPYFIAAFCDENRDIDVAYRKANSLPEAPEVNAVCIELSEDFPCAPRFSSACCMYLAAMLVIDEHGELSDKLYDKYSDMMSIITSGIPSFVEKISDRYI